MVEMADGGTTRAAAQGTLDGLVCTADGLWKSISFPALHVPHLAPGTALFATSALWATGGGLVSVGDRDVLDLGDGITVPLERDDKSLYLSIHAALPAPQTYAAAAAAGLAGAIAAIASAGPPAADVESPPTAPAAVAKRSKRSRRGRKKARAARAAKKISHERAHLIWAHASGHRLKRALREYNLEMVKDRSSGECHTCSMTKSKRQNRPPPSQTKLRRHDVVAIDYASCSIAGAEDQKVFLVVEYLGTRRLFVRPAESRNARTQPDTVRAIFAAHGTPKHVRFDGEFKSKALIDFLELGGTQVQRTVPDQGHQNGHVEQAQHQVSRTAAALLFSSGAPADQWPSALHHACFMWNATPHGKSRYSPFRLHDRRSAPATFFKGVYGQRVYVNVPKIKREHKFAPNAEYLTFVGLREGSKGYLVMNDLGHTVLRTDVSFPEELVSGFTGLPMGISQPTQILVRNTPSGGASVAPAPAPAPAPAVPPVPAPAGGQEEEEEKESDEQEENAPAGSPLRTGSPTQGGPPAPSGTPETPPRAEGSRSLSPAEEFNLLEGFHDYLAPPVQEQEEQEELEMRQAPEEQEEQTDSDTETESSSSSSDTDGSKSASPGGNSAATAEQLRRFRALQPTASRLSPTPTPRRSARLQASADTITQEEEEDPSILAARLARVSVLEKQESRDRAHDKSLRKAMARAAALAADVPRTREEAGRAEMQQLRDRGTYSIVAVPPGQHVIAGHMIYTDKYDADGTYLRAKARFVANGAMQLPGTYGNPTAHTLEYRSVRLLLALAAKHSIPLIGGDVSGAYLYSSLPDDRFVYVLITKKNLPLFPEEDQATFHRQKEEHPNRRVVLRMHKYIYGLMDAGAEWSKNFRRTLKGLGLVKHSACRCVYSMPGRSPDRMAVVAFYVDDFLVICADPVERQRIVAAIAAKYDLKHVGPATEFLGMKIVQDPRDHTIQLSSPAKTRELAETYLAADTTPALVPMPASLKSSRSYLSEKDSPEARAILAAGYLTVVGKIGHLVTTLRLDVKYAHRFLCEGMQAPGPVHEKVLLHVLRYLKGTSDFFLTFPGGDRRGHEDVLGASADPLPGATRRLAGASDATLSDCTVTGLSTSGYIVWYHSAPIDWYSKRQKTVARSTAHSEYMAADPLVSTLLHLQDVLGEFNCAPAQPIPALMDNQTALAWTNGKGKEFSLRHVRIAYHGVREAVERKQVKFQFVKSSLMPADMFTKPLDRQAFHNCLQLCLAGGSLVQEE